VHDIGVDVSASSSWMRSQYKADIVAMSALLTFTAPEQAGDRVLKEAGIRDQVKVVGGGHTEACQTSAPMAIGQKHRLWSTGKSPARIE
jgi:methanogenic corrinoid protein MtbC1